MPVPQVGNPVPYGDAPGFDAQQRAYNQIRLSQLLQGASPDASQGQRDGAYQAGKYSFLPEGQNVDDRFINSTWSVPASSSDPVYAIHKVGGSVGEYGVPQQGGGQTIVSVDMRSGMPHSYHEAPYNPSPVFSGQREEYLNAIPMHSAIPGVRGNSYQPQVEMTTPQSSTPAMPPLPQAPPNPNPFYRRPAPSMGQMMIEPPQFAPPQPDSSAQYVPYGGRF